jgi:hypothetical protein
MVLVTGSPVWWAKNRKAATARFALFGASAVCRGMIAGYGLGMAADFVGEPATRVAVGTLGIAAAFEVASRRNPTICIRRQVPSRVKGTRIFGPTLYGGILGAAILTFIRSRLVYLYVAAILLVGSPLMGVVAGAAYGLSYAATVLILGRRESASADPMALAGHVLGAIERIRRPASAVAVVAAALLVSGTT